MIESSSYFSVCSSDRLRVYINGSSSCRRAVMLTVFGSDYTSEPYIAATYKMTRSHKWYLEPRLVTVNDLHAFDPSAGVRIVRSAISSVVISSS